MKKTVLLLLMFTILLPSCSSDDDTSSGPDVDAIDDTNDDDNTNVDDNDDDGDQNDNTTSRAIRVVLPEGSTFDLTTTTIMSFLEEFSVDAEGNAMANISEGERSLVILQDADENPIMMGQLNSDQLELSIETTVETALYFGLGTIFLPEEVRVQFDSGIRDLPGVNTLVTQAEDIFVANPANFLASTQFATVMQSFIGGLDSDRDFIDIRPVINTDAQDVRSGLNIEPADGPVNTISVANAYRRRAHAFIYKVASTDENNVETILINDVAAEEANFASDVIVGPAAGVNGFISTITNALRGKGVETFRKVSDSRDLPLEDNENSATYKVRVVGPALTAAQLTDIEEDKLRQLEFETLGYDFVLPIFLSIVDQQGLLEDLDETNFEPFIRALMLFASTVDPINEALNQGDFAKALQEFINAAVDGSAAGLFGDLTEAFAENLKIEAVDLPEEQANIIVERADNFLAILNITDLLLQLSDTARIVINITSSNLLEEFEVTATRNRVRIAPEEASVGINEQRTFQAFVSNASNLEQGQSIEYEWSTTGNFGFLLDDTGVFVDSFTTTQDQARYIALEFSGSDQNDEVRVEAFLVQTGTNPSRTRINEATALINTQPSGFVIAPPTRIIGGDDDIRLYIEDREGNPLIRANSDFDYRVAWSTPGVHGAFDGTQRDVSIINEDDVIYSALDEEVDTGQETVTARIFARRKGETGSFTFLGDTEATITISNFEIVEYDLEAEAWWYESNLPPPPGRTSAGFLFRNSFIIPREERAVSYSIEIFEFRNSFGNTLRQLAGQTFTWTNDSQPTRINVFDNSVDTRRTGNSSGSDGDFWIGTGFGGGEGVFERNLRNILNPLRGVARARVTITLDGRL